MKGMMINAAEKVCGRMQDTQGKLVMEVLVAISEKNLLLGNGLKQDSWIVEKV